MAGELATAYVQILPSARGIQGHLASQIGGPLSSVGDQAGLTAGKRFAGKFSRVAKIGLIGAAGGLAAGLALIFKTGWSEQSDFLKGQAQLTAGVKSTGGAANVTVKHMENLAGSIQGFSGQTDDSIVAAEQLLLTFTKIRNTKTDKVFDQATLAAANMAAKMGGDASTYAIQLGKALNDPVKGVTALQRVGVSFTAGQKKTIESMVKTGNIAGAQRIILKELQTEFGGAAKAAGQTLPGQMARAKRSFEDIAQSVLAGMMPVLLKISSWIQTTGIPAFKRLVSWVQRNWPAFRDAIVSTWTNYIAPVFTAIGRYIATYIIPPIKQLVGYVVAHWPQISAAFVMAWNTIRPAIMAWAGMLKSIWDSVIKPLVGWIQAHWPQISAVIKVVMIAGAVYFKIFAVAMTVLYNSIAFTIRLLATVFSWWFHNVVERYIRAIVAVVRVGAAGVSAAIHGIGVAVHAIGSFFAGAYNAAAGWINRIVGAVGGLPGRIRSFGGGLLNAGKHIIGQLFQGIRNAVGAAGRLAADIGSAIVNAIKSSLNTLLHLPLKLPKIHVKGTNINVGGQTIIPRLAGGAMTLGPTVAVVGDNRSGKELIAPLDSPQTVHLLAAAMSRAGGGKPGGDNIVKIYPRPNQSEREIGMVAAHELGWMARG